MEKDKALELLKKYITNENLIKHSIATSAVMKNLALKLNADQEKWSLAGLLHDIDAELTKDDIKTHTHKAVEILKENLIDEDIIKAIKMHNPCAWDKNSDEPFHVALRASETITGLIVATALVYPDKKLSSVKVESVLKRFKDKRFAAGADRNTIMECEKLGIPLRDFIEISLNAMKEVSDELGL
jgi:putative nucleotidyltransferase with HDIG domain